MRWPFAKKQKTEEAPEEKSPTRFERDWASIQLLRRWRDIGQEFEYLGRRMTVASHSRLEIKMVTGDLFADIRAIPELRARYVDDHGVVRTLDLGELEALTLARHSLNPDAK
jgi:hypothetical protein